MSNSDDRSADDSHRGAVDGYADFDDDDAYDASDEESGATRGGGGGRYLRDLADTLRGAGLEVVEYDGWEDRGRSTGGLSDGPLGIVIHHTASGRGSDGRNDADYMTKVDANAPIANLYLDRQGTWWVLAAGATNTNGKGGPWGPIPQDGANTRVIGIEAGNNGIGEPWPSAMQDSYVRGVAALADQYGIDGNNVLSHQEWAPGRKVDPAGPSRFGSINGSNTWDMNSFRTAVDAARGNSGGVRAVESAAPASGAVYVVRPGDAWWSIAEKTMGNPRDTWQALAEANGGEDRVLLTGAVLTIPGGGGGAPAPTATEYPGEAKRDMTGPIVLAWQEALIAHGVIADNDDNRDGEYGGGMEAAVLELQQSWDWSDADGVAGSGTWKKLHS